MTFSSGPPIITDGPAKVAAVGGGSTAVGATFSTVHWLVIVGVTVALLGILLTAMQGYRSRRRTETDWKK